MKDQTKTKEQLANELEKMRQRVAELEQADAERKQVKEELQESEERYRLFAENVTDVIWTMDMDLRFTYVSPSTERMRGYTVEESMAQSVEDYLSPESLELARHTFVEELAIEATENKDLFRSRTLVLEQKCKDGSTIWTESRMTFLRNSDNKAVGILGITRDVTDRKGAEEALKESEEKYRALVNQMEEGFAIIRGSRIRFANKRYGEIVGEPAEKLIGEKYAKFLAPEDLEQARQIGEKLTADGKVNQLYEFVHLQDDGRRVLYEVSLREIIYEGKPSYAVVLRDVTERKRAEEALRESEAKLSLIFQSISDGIIVSDLEGKIVEENQAAVRLQGYSDKEEVIGRNGFEFIAEKDRARATEDAMKAIEMGYGPAHEYTFIDKYGREYDAEASASLMRDSAGNTTGFISVFRDISERKSVEEALKESEEKLRLTFESITDGIVVTDLQGKIVDMNEAAVRMIGMSREEVINKDGLSLLKRKEHKDFIDLGKQALQEDVPILITDRKMLPTRGNSHDADISLGTLHDSDGNPTGYVAVVRDITERKRAEQEKLKAITEKAAIIDAMGDGLITISVDGKILSVNPAFEKLCGTKEDEFKDKDAASFIPRFIKPEEQERISDIFGATLKGDTYGGKTFTLLNRNGQEIPIFATASFISDAEGNTTTTIVAFKDISNIKEAEEARLESEERYKAIFNHSLFSVYVCDLKGNFLDVNDTTLDLLGYTREEIQSLNFASLIDEEELPAAQQILADVKRTGSQKKTAEFSWRRKNGDYVLVETESAILYREGKPYGIQGIAKDITESRKAEEALKESEEKYRALVNQMEEGFAIIRGSRIRFANERYGEIVGEPAEKLIGEKYAKFLAPEDLEQARQIGEKLTADGKVNQLYEFVHLQDDGRRVLYEVSLREIIYEGKPSYAVVLRDVTERKRAEDALRESEEKLRLTFESITDGIMVTDLQGKIVDINGAAARMAGISREEVINKDGLSLLKHKEHKDFIELGKQALQGDASILSTERKISPSAGNAYDADISLAIMHDSDGNPTGYVAVIRDITERKRAEEEKLKAVTERAAIIDAMGDGLVTAGMDGKIISVNPAMERLIGYNEDEFINKDAMSLISRFIKPEEQEDLSAVIGSTLKGDIPESKTFTLLDPEGQEIPILATTSFILDEEGKPATIIIMVKDITYIRQAEEEKLKAVTERAAIIDAMGDGLVTVGMDGKMLSVNPAMERISGYNKDEFINKDAFSLIPRFIKSEEQEELTDMFTATLKGDVHESKTFTLRNQEGRELTLLWTTSLILDQEGKPAAILILFKDITYIKDAEEALRKSEEKYRLIAENVTDIIFTMDMNLRLTYISPSVTAQTGYSVEEAMARGLEDTLTPASLEVAMNTILGGPPEEHVEELLRTGTMELEVYCKDASTIWIEVETSLLYDAEGKAVGILGVARDITQRRKAEEALRKSEEKYRTVLETIEEAYYEVDLAGNFTFFNDSLCRIIGYPRDEAMGMNNRRYMDDETARAVYKIFNRVYRTGKPDRAFGWELIRKEGTKSYVEASISLMREPSGEPVGFRGIIRDITERKQAEEALKTSEEKLRAMFEAITDGIVVTDLQGMILDVNDAIVQMSGMSRKDIIGQDGFSLIPREERNKVMEGGKKVVRGETGPVRMEHEVSPVVGSSSTTNLVLGTMHDSEGNPTGFVAIVQDITERKKAEDALKASEAKYRDLVESISDVIYSLDEKGVATYVSPVVESVLGYNPSELIGSSFADVIYQEDLKSATEGFMKTLSVNTGPGEIRVVTKSGEVRWVSSSNHPIFEEDHVIGIAGLLTDITGRKRAEEEREKLLHELEDKSKELEQLLFISSHDLRSPLVNIQGFAREMEFSLQDVHSVLDSDDIPPTVKEKLADTIDKDITDSLNYILASTTKIDTLLTGLLKVSRLGRATLAIEKLNMKDLIAEVVESYEFQAREAGVKLEVGRLPQCRGDRAQINQVFSNLIGNALKYLDPERPGIIRISGRKEDNKVVYTVEDNGIGIAPEHQEAVFQIFQRVDPGASDGEGLGLAIVRRILERLGGITWLESEPGRGSRFHVALPIRDY